MTDTCDEEVYPKERYGCFHGYRCSRPVFEGGKCKIHCDSAVKRRLEKARKDYEEKHVREKHQREMDAILVLKSLGYTITPPKGL